MTIFHKIDDFLLDLFPELIGKRDDKNAIINQLSSFYTFGLHKPSVTIQDDVVRIDIDSPKILKEADDFRRVVGLSEKGRYSEAKPILRRLLNDNPTNSEYHRIYGQILSDEGDQDEAINYLIDALRWDATNGYALLMMGNIFAKFKNDIDTARKYYDQVLAVKPNDNIALNNIGANLLQLGRMQEGVDYLEKAYAVNPNYPNTSFGLATAYEKMGYPLMAFDFAIECVKRTPVQHELRKMALAMAMELAEDYIKSHTGLRTFAEYKSFLETKFETEIRAEEDATIPTIAKVEIAENYGRDYHLIKFKHGQKAVEHLMMHELVHLEFAFEARAEHVNMLFTSGAERKAQFIRDNEKELHKLKKQGYSEDTIANFMTSLYEGINRQVYNAPIDLFIEDHLYEVYKEIRPQQFLSLIQLIEEGKAAVTNKQAEKLTPRSVHSASKVLNIVSAMQLKDLYGIDVVRQFNALPSEQKEAERMWTEFGEYRKDKKPGEEYELVQHWGKDLKLDNYFELVDEEDFRNRPKTVEEVLQSATEDPYGTEVDKNFKDRQTKQFLETQAAMGLNMAVMWFMVGALEHFARMTKESIKNTAFEIAVIGTQGINPAPGHSYTLRSIPGKEFSGYHLLAYYYVSWKLAVPEMLPQLKLPFDKEFESAETLFKAKK